jgi:amino acid permease
MTFIDENYDTARLIQMLIFNTFTQIPMTWVRNIAILHKLSMFGTLALMYTVIVSVIEFPFYFKENYSLEKLKLWDFNINIVKTLCMYFFAFANHNAILGVINEIKGQTEEKAYKIVKYTFQVELATYIIVLFTGYLSTFDETNEIFIDRPGVSIFLVIGKALYIITLTCHIGLYYFISRPSLEMAVHQGKRFTDNQ